MCQYGANEDMAAELKYHTVQTGFMYAVIVAVKVIRTAVMHIFYICLTIVTAQKDFEK